MKKKQLIVPLVLSALFASYAQAETPSAEMLANTCVGCHGPKGVSQGPATPSIASFSKDYIIDAMNEYAKNERASTIMGRIARGYSEKEIELLASYFPKQKLVSAKQKVDSKKAKQGAALHKKYCEKCHEDNGRSAEDDAGVLAGQWKPYLTYTMHDFLSGNREMTKKMKGRVNKMIKAKGKKSLSALNEFYANQ